MSRRIIHSVIIPILERILTKGGYLSQGFHRDMLFDEDLEVWLERELSIHLGVIRQQNEGHCLELEMAINEEIAKGQEAFEQLLMTLLREYLKQYLNKPEEELDREVKKLLEKLKKKAPPDRLQKQRETFEQVWKAI